MTEAEPATRAERRTPVSVAVGPEQGFPTGRFVMVTLRGREVGVIRLADGALRAWRNWCPHKGAPICRGIVGGTWPPGEPGALSYGHEGQVLACPWHGFEYDLRTGEEMFGTGRTRLLPVAVAVQDGQVVVTG